MIIVEGPDGAGKSTLVTHLEERLGITREPRAVSAGAEKLKPIGQYISDEMDRGFGLRIYDRFALISSPMYLSLPNPTFSEELLDLVWLEDAHRRFRKINPVIILCLPPFEVVKANLEKDAEGHYTTLSDHWQTVYWSYHNWLAANFGVFATSIMHYDYTVTGNQLKWRDKNLDGLLRWAKARVEKNR